MSNKIGWCDETWNPIIGCSKVSRGCDNCYAERFAKRLAEMPQTTQSYGRVVGGKGWTGDVVLQNDMVTKPQRWKNPKYVFVNSMGDLFHEKVPFGWIDEVMSIIATCPQHLFIVLTKRPERMKKYADYALKYDNLDHEIARAMGYEKHVYGAWPLKNLVLGVSIEDQRTADARIPFLLDTQAEARVISYEPALRGVRLGYDVMAKTDWVIAGAEKGPKARDIDVQDFLYVMEECRDANVPFYFKGTYVSKKWTTSLCCREYTERYKYVRE